MPWMTTYAQVDLERKRFSCRRVCLTPLGPSMIEVEAGTIGRGLPTASAHAAQSAVCAREVVPLHLTAEQNRRLRTLCWNPTLSISANVVEYLLKDVMNMGVNTANPSRDALKQEHIRELVHNPDFAPSVSDYISAGFDVTDLRFLNGSVADPAFDLLLHSLRKRLEARDHLAPDERRQPDASRAVAPQHQVAVRRTPLAPSMRVLHQLVVDDMHADAGAAAKLASCEAKLPSLGAFAARMSPTHPSRNTSSRYTGVAGIQWTIQRKTARKQHTDTHYCNAQAKLGREVLVVLRQANVSALFVSDDNKCKISVGQPGHAQTAATRSRRADAGQKLGPQGLLFLLIYVWKLLTASMRQAFVFPN